MKPTTRLQCACGEVRQSVRFFAKLFGAWVSMGFRVPKITFVEGTLELPAGESVAT